MKTNGLLLLLCLAGPTLSPLSAQDNVSSGTQDDSVAENTAAAPKDPQAVWQQLLKRRRAIYGELLSLQKDFAAAKTSEEKRGIRDTYTDLITEFDIEIYPEMLELAPVIYEASNDDLGRWRDCHEAGV